MSMLVENLRAWSPMIASGYECPAAAQTIDEAASEIERLRSHLEKIASAPTVFDGGSIDWCRKCAAKALGEAK